MCTHSTLIAAFVVRYYLFDISLTVLCVQSFNFSLHASFAYLDFSHGPDICWIISTVFQNPLARDFIGSCVLSKSRRLDIWCLDLPSKRESELTGSLLRQCWCWVWAIRKTGCCCWLLTWRSYLPALSVAKQQQDICNSPTSESSESVEYEPFTQQGRHGHWEICFFFLPEWVL